MNILEHLNRIIQNNKVLDILVTKTLEKVLPTRTAHAWTHCWSEEITSGCEARGTACPPYRDSGMSVQKSKYRKDCCYHDGNMTTNCNYTYLHFVSCCS